MSLEVWSDASMIELFGDGGTVVISDLAYPDPDSVGVSLFHGEENPTIRALVVHKIKIGVHRDSA